MCTVDLINNSCISYDNWYYTCSCPIVSVITVAVKLLWSGKQFINIAVADVTEGMVCSSRAITFIDCSDSRVAGGYIF